MNEAPPRVVPPTQANDNTSPEELARLASYRSAAQAIRRQDAPLGERGDRIIALMQQARAESDPWTRDLAQQVVWAQAEWMLQANEALRRSTIRGRLESAARRLRLKGYETCPECEQRLSDRPTGRSGRRYERPRSTVWSPRNQAATEPTSDRAGCPTAG